MEKSWYKSKTLWFNIATIVFMVLGYVVENNMIPDPEVVATLSAIINIWLRFKTVTALTK